MTPCDALAGLWPERGLPELAYGIVKLTFAVSPDGGCVVAPPQPLCLPTARLATGSDRVPMKVFTDVIVRGSARGAGARVRDVRLEVGDTVRQIRACGPRRVEVVHSRPRLGAPEPFDRVPLTWTHAYGGADERVPAGGPCTVGRLIERMADHPGVYPRNPFGRGYVCGAPPDGMVLHQLDDPARPLTEDRLVADPARWWQQPLPMALEPVSAVAFPRSCWLGLTAWRHPPRGTVLEEVSRGWLPHTWADMLPGPVPLGFLQEAPLGLAFAPLRPGTPLRVTGMHPARQEVTARMPDPPHVEVGIDGHREACRVQPITVCLEPAEERLVVTYVARRRLHRPRLPGIHREVDVAVWVRGDVVATRAVPWRAGCPSEAG